MNIILKIEHKANEPESAGFKEEQNKNILRLVILEK